MTSLFEPEARASIRGRIGRLGPNVAPRWGRLTARISGKDYGVLVYRHLDHHLTQFGA